MFSELIDQVCLEVSRPDMKASSVTYLNQTIRECHLDPERNTAVFLWPNYREAQVTADADSGFYWNIPDTTVFQGLQEVRFDSVIRDGCGSYASERIPGRVGETQEFAYQRSADRIVFKGYGKTGGIVSLSYFEFPKSLKYYAVGARPATYDSETGTWSYLTAVTDDEKTLARANVSNWLLERWNTVLQEGLRAKIYKRLSDATRAPLCYSLYQGFRSGLQNSELADLGGVR